MFVLCYSIVLDVLQCQHKRLFGKNISDMTDFCVEWYVRLYLS